MARSRWPLPICHRRDDVVQNRRGAGHDHGKVMAGHLDGMSVAVAQTHILLGEANRRRIDPDFTDFPVQVLPVVVGRVDGRVTSDCDSNRLFAVCFCQGTIPLWFWNGSLKVRR